MRTKSEAMYNLKGPTVAGRYVVHAKSTYNCRIRLDQRYVIGVASSYGFSRSGVPRLKRAYILILIINYTCLKEGLSVKRA